MATRGLREPEDRRQVDPKDVVPLVFGELEDRATVVDADGVQHDVQATELVHDLGDDALARAVLGEIGLDQLVACTEGGQVGAEGIESALVAIDDRDQRTRSGVGEGAGSADSAAAGNEHSRAVESEPIRTHADSAAGLECVVRRHRCFLAIFVVHSAKVAFAK